MTLYYFSFSFNTTNLVLYSAKRKKKKKREKFWSGIVKSEMESQTKKIIKDFFPKKKKKRI